MAVRENITSSAPQSHVLLAPLSLLRLQLIDVVFQHVGVGSFAPYRHMFLSPASFRQRIIIPLLRIVVVEESLTPERHVLLAPPPLVDSRRLCVEVCREAFAPHGDVVATPRSLLRVEPGR